MGNAKELAKLNAIDQFRRDGFALTRFNIGGDMTAALYECKDLLWHAKRGLIREARVEDDFPHILGGINVWGIDNPFCRDRVSNLRGLVHYGNIGALLHDFAGWKGADIELARLHCGDRFKHQGFWHVDAPLQDYEKSIVAIVYLMPEKGFRIQVDQFRVVIIEAEAGDVLLMRSSMAHKGFYTKRRMHLHMRFVRRDDLGFNQEIWSIWQPRHSIATHQPASLWRQTKNFVRYMTPGKDGSNHWQ